MLHTISLYFKCTALHSNCLVHLTLSLVPCPSLSALYSAFMCIVCVFQAALPAVKHVNQSYRRKQLLPLLWSTVDCTVWARGAPISLGPGSSAQITISFILIYILQAVSKHAMETLATFVRQDPYGNVVEELGRQ